MFLMNTKESKVSVSPSEEYNINSLEPGLWSAIFVSPGYYQVLIVTVPVCLLADISAETNEWLIN